MSSVEKEGKRHRCAEQANKLVLASDTSYFFLQLRQDGPKVMLTGTSQKVPILLFSANPALVHQGYLSGTFYNSTNNMFMDVPQLNVKASAA